MAGIQNLQGYGQAQVLPQGPSLMPLAEQLNQQKQQQYNRQRHEEEVKRRNEKELYDLIGDNLNLKNFNSAIQNKVIAAQKELANKIKTGGLGYADAYLEAINKAGELGDISNQFNQVESQINLTKKEYEPDKRINSASLELIARKKALDELNTKGKIDLSKNYFDEALNEYPEHALTDASNSIMLDFMPEEKQPLSFDVINKNSVGQKRRFKWTMDNYPSIYDVKQKGDYEEPTVSIKSIPSGLKDEQGRDIPMLSDEAYNRYKVKTSDIVSLNRRVKENYGVTDFKSPLAEKLRRVEAYKDAELRKPKPKTRDEVIEPRITINTGVGSGKREVTINDVYKEIDDAANDPRRPNKSVPLNELGNDVQDVVLKTARTKLGNDITQADIFVKKGDDGVISIYKAEDGSLVSPLTKKGTNLGAQVNTKAKAAVVEQGNNGQQSITPDEWNKQWSKLKKGQSMVGLDGKTYIKQ